MIFPDPEILMVRVADSPALRLILSMFALISKRPTSPENLVSPWYWGTGETSIFTGFETTLTGLKLLEEKKESLKKESNRESRFDSTITLATRTAGSILNVPGCEGIII